MGQVVVTVNGHPYTMQCNDGEEDHLTELAQLLDTEVKQIRGTVGQVGDIRLLLMAGLIIADRLSESLKRIEDLQEQIRGIKETRTAAPAAAGAPVETGNGIEEKVAERIAAAAERLERLAGSVPAAAGEAPQS